MVSATCHETFATPIIVIASVIKSITQTALARTTAIHRMTMTTNPLSRPPQPTTPTHAFWQPSLGAVPATDGGCVFRIWAPNADRVQLHLHGASEAYHEMQGDRHGYWTLSLDDIAAGQRYTYTLDGTDYPDPVSRYQPEGIFGPSAVVARDYPWTDAAWRGRPMDDLIIYELHIGTFTDGGTFASAVERLDELVEVGITAVELLPVAQFSGARNWGYDGVLQFAVQDSYGGPDGLKSFVDACHAREIAVLLDVVYNHFGPEGSFYPAFGPYLTEHYKTPWGPAINFDGPYSDEVRAFFIENVLYWMHEYHLDGLRLDATHHLYDGTATHILQAMAQTVAEHRRRANRHFHLIAESDTNDPRLLRPTNVGGIGLDAQWNDDFHHTVHALLTNETGHYYAGYDTLDSLVKALREGFVYSGQYSEFRKRSHGAPSHDIPGHQLIVFTQNHDQIGNRLPSERIATYLPFDALKLWIGLAALSPYVPMIFMGEEYAEPALFNYFTDFSSDELIEAVTNGRMEAFALGADGEGFPPPQDDATFQVSKLNHDLKHHGKHAVMLAFHRELFRLRRELPVLADLAKERMEVLAYTTANVLFWRRWRDHDSVIAAYNLGQYSANVTLPVPAGRWRCLIDSAEPRWAEDASDPQASGPERIVESGGELRLTLPALSFVAFASTQS